MNKIAKLEDLDPIKVNIHPTFELRKGKPTLVIIINDNEAATFPLDRILWQDNALFSLRDGHRHQLEAGQKKQWSDLLSEMKEVIENQHYQLELVEEDVWKHTAYL